MLQHTSNPCSRHLPLSCPAGRRQIIGSAARRAGFKAQPAPSKRVGTAATAPPPSTVGSVQQAGWASLVAEALSEQPYPPLLSEPTGAFSVAPGISYRCRCRVRRLGLLNRLTAGLAAAAGTVAGSHSVLFRHQAGGGTPTSRSHVPMRHRDDFTSYSGEGARDRYRAVAARWAREERELLLEAERRVERVASASPLTATARWRLQVRKAATPLPSHAPLLLHHAAPLHQQLSRSWGLFTATPAPVALSSVCFINMRAHTKAVDPPKAGVAGRPGPRMAGGGGALL